MTQPPMRRAAFVAVLLAGLPAFAQEGAKPTRPDLRMYVYPVKVHESRRTKPASALRTSAAGSSCRPKGIS